MNRTGIVLLIIICSLLLINFDIAFAYLPDEGFKPFMKDYGRMIANIIFIFLLFVFIVRPLVKTVKDYQNTKSNDINSFVSGFGKFTVQKDNFVTREEFHEKFDRILSAIDELSKKIDKK